jgi:hypothetical protein
MKLMPDKRPRPAVTTETDLAERCARSLKIRAQTEIDKLRQENDKLRQQDKEDKPSA